MQETHPADTCSRCGLRQVTRELEEKGVKIRLCDDCYWGKEPEVAPDSKEQKAPS